LPAAALRLPIVVLLEQQSAGEAQSREAMLLEIPLMPIAFTC
jgi:hypothetical protein